jgi:hypothetical protein
MKETGIKILMLDIETAPAIAFTWRLHDVTIGLNQIIKDGYMLMWSAKWLGKPEIMWDAVYKHAEPAQYATVGERAIAKSLWQLMDEADVIVAHNGTGFDFKHAEEAFITHNLPPVSTFKAVDTLTEARRIGSWISKKLEYLVKKFKLGKKINTGGFELWEEVMRGHMPSWKKMVKYCMHDTRLEERLYLKLRSRMKNHPNLGLFAKTGERVCPNCGSERMKKKGFFYTNVSKFQRWICLDCRKNVRDTHRHGGTPVVGV